MRILIWLKETSQPLEFNSSNTYLKQGMYCIIQGDDVIKIPIQNISFIREKYGKHLHNNLNLLNNE